MSFLKTTAIQHLNASSPAINLTSGGNVGIGTSSPSQKAEVSGSGDTFLRVTGGLNNAKGVEFYRGTGNATQVYGVGEDLRVYTGGLNSVNIDSSGRVTMPYQPAFRAYSNAGSYSTTGADIAFGSTNFNIGGHYNTSNGRFTAPVSGVYHIIWSTSSFGATSFSLDLFINGSSVQYSEQNNSLTYFVTGQSQLRYLNAGDYATLRLRFGTINLSDPSTNFQAFLVA